MAEWLGDKNNMTLLLAALSALATFAAAATAILGPIVATNMQRKHAKENAELDTKLRIFAVLMQYRNRWGQREPVQALNLIDIVWSKNAEVRRAWHDFFRTQISENEYSTSQQQDHYRTLLETIAKDLGFQGGFSTDDYARVYRSNAVEWEDQRRSLENRQAIALLTAQNNAQPPQEGQPPEVA